MVGETIGESGNSVWVGERGVTSIPGNSVGGLVDTGVLVAFVETSVDSSPIPKDREAWSLSSNRGLVIHRSWLAALLSLRCSVICILRWWLTVLGGGILFGRSCGSRSRGGGQRIGGAFCCLQE